MWNTDSISYQTDENWVWNLIKNELYETINNEFPLPFLK